jgi:hypothetical protein
VHEFLYLPTTAKDQKQSVLEEAESLSTLQFHREGSSSQRNYEEEGQRKVDAAVIGYRFVAFYKRRGLGVRIRSRHNISLVVTDQRRGDRGDSPVLLILSYNPENVYIYIGFPDDSRMNISIHS